MRAFVCTLMHAQYGPCMASWLNALMAWKEHDPSVAFDHYMAYGDDMFKHGHDNVVYKYRRAQEIFLRGDWDRFIAVEQDMLLPEDAFIRLDNMHKMGSDVAYGLYVFRHGRNRWSAFTHLEESGGQSVSDNRDRARRWFGTIKPVAGVGFGLTSITRHVMHALPFRRGGSACNDWYFASDANKAGYIQRCDLGLVCGHMTMEPSPRIYWPDPEADDLYRIEYLDDERLAVRPSDEGIRAVTGEPA